MVRWFLCKLHTIGHFHFFLSIFHFYFSYSFVSQQVPGIQIQPESLAVSASMAGLASQQYMQQQQQPVIPVIQQVQPVIQQAQPVIQQVQPVIQQVQPVNAHTHTHAQLTFEHCKTLLFI